MNVSVIIVAYHGDKWLSACMDSLASASAQRLHVVLVDNAGNSGFQHLGMERFDTEIVKTPRPMGFAEANNYALAHAAHLEEAVLFLNQDTISYPGWIDTCLSCFAASEKLGAVSPLIRTYDGSGWDPSFMACIGSEAVLSEPDENPWFQTQNAPAPSLIVRTDVLEQSGPFDPVFGSYYEDYDLCRRIRALGFQIGFCRRAEIAHFSGSSTDTPERERKRMRQIIRNRVLYQLRESETRLPLLIRQIAVNLPRNLMRGLLRTPSSQPPAITLKAHGDLLQIYPRLASRRRDEKAWDKYLQELGWPSRIPGLNPHPADHHVEAVR